MTFQHIIQTLNNFWDKQNCIIGQPYGVEVGAGTGNPHTFFRVLGPEPFNVAYVEPSRRPTDGRYGQSPNRFQHYYQYQVILKPAPKFNQELFIESLIAIGIDPTKHDIRFVEDNWESTPLGAWGLGWEVWCDGMEVAQYTYFQQMAGIPLEIPALEITYGLERLAMYIQDVDTYKDMKWNDTTTYAALFERHEFWQATHNFETSTPESLKALYEIFEKEVATQLEQKNFWSAYDYLLKLSHTFNLLDARNMVSVSDRIAKFGLMGKFTKQISTQYLEERKALGYPLMGNMASLPYKPPTVTLEQNNKKHVYQNNVAIVELGFEEIPSEYLAAWSSEATHQWFREKLRTFGITFRKAYLHFSPRRIVMKIVQPSKQGRVVQKLKGPAVSVCYDESGRETQALLGFMKKNDIDISSINRETVDGKNIVTAEKENIFPLDAALQYIASDILAVAPKSRWMVWEKDVPAFIRPLRWILAFHNNKKLSISLMNIHSSKSTLLPRYERPAVTTVASAQEYLQFLRIYGVLVSAKKRAARIERTIKKGKGSKIGKFSSMIEKNTYLTENPQVKSVKLSNRYTQLPRELITLILEKNQMYPLTVNAKNDVFYSIVSNQYRVHKRIEYGNQKVAMARLDDGLFYFTQDAKKTLAADGSDLANVGFHPKAGSYVEKKARITVIVNNIYAYLSKEVPEHLKKALTLIKNDKATALGREFPVLEGVIGRVYALRDGVQAEVASLLSDHYLPYEPNGGIPETEEGAILSLADKLDSLVTLASVEKLPEGSHDPFEIRKTVYRILTLLIKGQLQLPLDNLLQQNQSLLDYTNRRFEQLLLDESIPQWIAHNVALGTSTNIGAKYQYAKYLTTQAVDEQSKAQMTETFKRVINILSKNNVDASILNADLTTKIVDTVEKDLLPFLHTEKPDVLLLEDKLHIFFEKVMVMDKDPEIQKRRLWLLATLKQSIQRYFAISFT